MPLPNYGYFNKEEKKHQELLFEMAPEIVDSEDSVDKFNPYAKESTNLSKKRAKVTTGMYIYFYIYYKCECSCPTCES